VASIDFNGQAVIVTGAGRGIGRAHAIMLAERGAGVVVNDIGSEIDGSGGDRSVASLVVDEILAAGGKAVASTADVASPEGGADMVRQCLDSFGRIDMLVHNAGIVLGAPFAEQPLEDVRRTLDIHLMGAYHVGQPAYREMVARKYGRIVFTTSGATFGHPMVHAYAAAKLGLVGLARCIHEESKLAGLDIKVNVMGPIAATRMARDTQKQRFGDLMDPANVAAVVAYLLSPQCAVSGETFHAGGSHAARIFLGMTRGWASGKTGLQPEEVARHLDEIVDPEGYIVPANANAAGDAIFQRATGRSDKMTYQEVMPKASRELMGKA
jgi:NAD(P)-dependent dehydrogenase (short-subunit alcohol dehydrogenase family)